MSPGTCSCNAPLASGLGETVRRGGTGRTTRGAFATLIQYSPASPTWPDLRRPVSSAATSHVCAPELNELGANENVFVRKTGNK
jgi:hypothetical protein